MHALVKHLSQKLKTYRFIGVFFDEFFQLETMKKIAENLGSFNELFPSQ